MFFGEDFGGFFSWAMGLAMGQIRTAAYLLASGIFAISMMVYFYRTAVGRETIVEAAVRYGMSLVGLGAYDYIFGLVRDFSRGLSEFVNVGNPFWATLGNTLKQLVDEILSGNPGSVTNFLLNLLGNPTLDAVLAAAVFVSVLGYVFVSAAHVIAMALAVLLGPLALATIPLPGRGNLAVGWFRFLVEVSTWPFVANVFVKATTELGPAQLFRDADRALIGALLLFFFGALSFLTPVIVHMFVGGASHAIGTLTATSLASTTVAATAAASHAATTVATAAAAPTLPAAVGAAALTVAGVPSQVALRATRGQ